MEPILQKFLDEPTLLMIMVVSFTFPIVVFYTYIIKIRNDRFQQEDLNREKRIEITYNGKTLSLRGNLSQEDLSGILRQFVEESKGKVDSKELPASHKDVENG